MKKKKKKSNNTIKPNNQITNLPIQDIYRDFSGDLEYQVKRENAYRLMEKEFLENQLINEINKEENGN